MAWIEKQYQLTSQAPLILHNGQTADPLNKYSKLMKAISSKRGKTDSDFEELAHIEFLAAFYLTKDERGQAVPCMPIDNLQALLIAGAKKRKEGMQAKSGVYPNRHAVLQYDGSHNPEDLWKDDRFRFVKAVRVGQAKVMRTRPIFQEWSFVLSCMIEDKVINPARILDWLTVAGTEVGAGDWRPLYGRFSVKEL